MVTVNRPPLPDFVVIGGSKSATHWLNVCVAPHPDIYVPPNVSEVFFFDRYFDRGTVWYARYFQGHRGEKRIGEVTSTYLAHSHAFQRLHHTIPRASLIVSLRNPVARAYSKYLHAWRKGDIASSLTFRQACDAAPEILTDGEYGRHLERWMQLFERDQFKLKVVDDIAVDPLGYLRDIYEWLGVDAAFEPHEATRGPVNTHETPRSLLLAHCAYRVSRYLHSKGLHRAVALAKNIGVRELVLSRQRNPQKEPRPLSLADQSWLQDYYASDVELLSKIAKRNLVSLWLDA